MRTPIAQPARRAPDPRPTTLFRMKIVALSLPVLLAASCTTTRGSPPASAWHGEVETWGTLREALHDGADQARVAVASAARPHVYAVGTLEHLRGEITIDDGDTWISEGHADRAVTTRVPDGAQATLLFAADVSEWQALTALHDVPAAELDAWIASRARAAGLDTSRPFPFVVEGGLRDLKMHVIAGECPIRARASGQPMTSPPYELELDATDGRLVGIYAEASTGIICLMGSRTHVHALLERDGGLTGHVETVGLAAGARLELPRR
jgi:hypothetical protein